MSTRIAVIEDDRNIRQMLSLHLRHHGYEVADASDGLAGLNLVKTFKPDLIVLDVMMPKLDGLELLPHVRRLTDAPVILLTAKTDIRTRVSGLAAGADDYVPKPFDVDELIARVETRLRRTSLDKPEYLAADDLEVDLKRQTVHRAGTPIVLSSLEFQLLVTFLRNKNHVLSREHLLELVWGYDTDVTPSAAERYVSYLRSKIDNGRGRKLIRTVRGMGYVLDA